MPFYRPIDATTPPGLRTARNLLALREALRDAVPERTQSETLLLATWNVRDFDKPQYGYRTDESIYYIAEIISHFDLVAVQEVYRDLRALDRVMAVLGGNWDYLVTDACEGYQGNDERLAFVYDKRKVKFGGLAGEVVMPPGTDDDGNATPALQIWRTPYICGFTAGWSRFMLATVHILWGGGDAEPPDRVAEIRRVASFLGDRVDDATAWARSLILLGDFNIFSSGDDTFGALIAEGFWVPEALRELPSNTAQQRRHYDQIAIRGDVDRLTVRSAGVFDYYHTVFRYPDDLATYGAEHPVIYTRDDGTDRPNPGGYFRTYWRTHQMSDHLPMWVELQIDYSDHYLRRKIAGATTPP